MISFICAIPQEPDDKAFMLSLYDSYYKLMYSIAYKYVSDIQTVDDIGPSSTPMRPSSMVRLIF